MKLHIYPFVQINNNLRLRINSVSPRNKILTIVTQQRFTYDQSSSDTQTTWYIPLDYINKTSDDWSSPAKTWLHSEEETVVDNVGAQDSWIVFNVNKTGRLHKYFLERMTVYYKFNYLRIQNHFIRNGNIIFLLLFHIHNFILYLLSFYNKLIIKFYFFK